MSSAEGVSAEHRKEARRIMDACALAGSLPWWNGDGRDLEDHLANWLAARDAERDALQTENSDLTQMVSDLNDRLTSLEEVLESLDELVPRYHEDHGTYENVAILAEQEETCRAERDALRERVRVYEARWYAALDVASAEDAPEDEGRMSTLDVLKELEREHPLPSPEAPDAR